MEGFFAKDMVTEKNATRRDTFLFHRTGTIVSRLLTILFILLPGCSAINPQPEILTPEPVRSPIPRINVFAAPRQPINMSRYQAILLPLSCPRNYPDNWSVAATRLVQDLFIKKGVFGTLKFEKRPGGRTEDKVYAGLQDRFDFIITGEIPVILYPSGNSRGRIALDLKVTSARTGTTLWHIYGETDLTPEPAKFSPLGNSPFRPAPSPVQGLSNIIVRMADLISAH